MSEQLLKLSTRPWQLKGIILFGVLFLFGLLLTACSAEVDSASPSSSASPAPAMDSTRGPASPSEPSETPRPAQTAQPTITPHPASSPAATEGDDFDGDRAFEHLQAQMMMGPRWPGSEGHGLVREYIAEQLVRAGWAVERQEFDYVGVEASNIIGRANVGAGPVILIGAHYDTRKIADQTPGSDQPVPGAVDGASGVAVLLELAQALEPDLINNEIWLVFFDVEDNGRDGIPGFDWIAGSTYMAQNLEIVPEAMVLADMVGDADQQLFYEGNSDPALRALLWEIAADLGYAGSFIPEIRHTMIDDHLPFAQLGIPSVDIIEFDYPYWHTVEDTADKASPESLLRVGRTLEVWLEERLNG